MKVMDAAEFDSAKWKAVMQGNTGRFAARFPRWQYHKSKLALMFFFKMRKDHPNGKKGVVGSIFTSTEHPSLIQQGSGEQRDI